MLFESIGFITPVAGLAARANCLVAGPAPKANLRRVAWRSWDLVHLSPNLQVPLRKWLQMRSSLSRSKATAGAWAARRKLHSAAVPPPAPGRRWPRPSKL